MEEPRKNPIECPARPRHVRVGSSRHASVGDAGPDVAPDATALAGTDLAEVLVLSCINSAAGCSCAPSFDRPSGSESSRPGRRADPTFVPSRHLSSPRDPSSAHPACLASTVRKDRNGKHALRFVLALAQAGLVTCR